MISVTFDEDKGTPRAILAIVVAFLLFAAVPVFLMAAKTPGCVAEIPKSVEGSTSTSNLLSWSGEQINRVRRQRQAARIFNEKSMR